MADTLDVVTLNEAKATLNIAGNDQDTELAGYVTAVSRQLDDRCGPVVARTITDELHDGGGGEIQTRLRPINSVTTLTEYLLTVSTTLTAETNATKPAAAYLAEVWPARSGSVRRRAAGADATFAVGRLNVKITYAAGRYATTTAVDAKFKQAAAILLANLWGPGQAGATETYGTTVGTFEGGIGVPFFAWPHAVIHLLADEILHPAVA